MKVTLDIPDSYALHLNPPTIEREFKLFAALMMVKQGRISVSRGSELAGLTIYDFLKECKENEIPVIDYSISDLEEEFGKIKKELL